jgi:hypothetical protein
MLSAVPFRGATLSGLSYLVVALAIVTLVLIGPSTALRGSPSGSGHIHAVHEVFECPIHSLGESGVSLECSRGRIRGWRATSMGEWALPPCSSPR